MNINRTIYKLTRDGKISMNYHDKKTIDFYDMELSETQHIDIVHIIGFNMDLITGKFTCSLYYDDLTFDVTLSSYNSKSTSFLNNNFLTNTIPGNNIEFINDILDNKKEAILYLSECIKNSEYFYNLILKNYLEKNIPINKDVKIKTVKF